MKREKVVCTLGTSDRTIEQFVDLLRAYGIKRVIDVRRFPTSKFDHFKRENLAKQLEWAGCSYDFFGDRLGGYRNGGYENYMKTDLFRKTLSEVERLARREPALILCAERLPWRCHRRFIAGELRERGWKIIHILEKGKTWEPREQLDLLKG